ncbi:tRNA (guanine-N1)-methyltransferase [Leptobacterium flavescens]|uniref:tRNA (Guanine-N1)-methyltransferase n=1 Tax=Leptobacterium flavescens TaxID=472055 RepID=A0A6P0UL78_9FLAO|nr:tRNA (guanine-N1)-methyltransferase [Leptobacterium flavescens]NER13282.1 tRNA (guanine-N1)-methyltransferase [Leptobacterium flavescens]
MKNLKLQLTCLLCVFTLITFAQTDEKTGLSLDSGPIDSQFEYVIKKSGNYQEYEVIKKIWINKLRRNVSDSLGRIKKETNDLLSKIDTQQGEITQLKADLNTTNTNLSQTTKEKESISFFGSLINKGFYKTIMWGIIAILTLLLLVFIYKFRNSNIVTQEARGSLAELEEEFEQHRRRALEREQKLSRQLQDELNKQKLMKK